MYRGRLERDLAIWVEKQMISPAQAQALLQEYDGRESSFSLGRVLMMIAACLVSAALLLLVAANWEFIARPARLGLLVAAIWVLHGAAAALLAQGRTALAQAALVLGTSAFGAALALVGQMYHLTGDLASMLLTWFLFTVLTALAFRSRATAFTCGFMAWGYFAALATEGDASWSSWSGLALPLMAAILIALVYYTNAPRLRHFAYTVFLGWLVWMLADIGGFRGALMLSIAGAVAFLACVLPQSPLHDVARRAGAAPVFYAFLATLIGLAILHTAMDIGIIDDDAGYWIWSRRLQAGIATLITCVGAIALAGRDNGAVRYLAYAVFAMEILYLAYATVGSILGTSGLFLVSGFVVAIAAWAVILLEKRMAAAGRGKAPA